MSSARNLKEVVTRYTAEISFQRHFTVSTWLYVATFS